jgi:hypothetical protein
MATYNDGREATVGDTVRLPDGRSGTVTGTAPERGNAVDIEVTVTLPARLVTPL